MRSLGEVRKIDSRLPPSGQVGDAEWNAHFHHNLFVTNPKPLVCEDIFEIELPNAHLGEVTISLLHRKSKHVIDKLDRLSAEVFSSFDQNPPFRSVRQSRCIPFPNYMLFAKDQDFIVQVQGVICVKKEFLAFSVDFQQRPETTLTMTSTLSSTITPHITIHWHRHTCHLISNWL